DLSNYDIEASIFVFSSRRRHTRSKRDWSSDVCSSDLATETELKERKDRIEDALNSTRAAVEEGIVSGGGTSLVDVYHKVAELNLENDEATGANIVLRALEEPVRQIVENAGLEGSIIVEKLKNEDVGVGFDAAKEEWVNMIE